MNESKLAKEWLEFAQQDLALAKELAEDGDKPPRFICWLAQQSCEKSIKACLVRAGIAFPKSHDLEVLRGLLPSQHAIRAVAGDFAALTEWAVESRYPGPWPQASNEEAFEALALATSCFVAANLDRS